MGEFSQRQAIQSMLAAKSIAVVGATENRASPGYRLLSYLLRFGYAGNVYPVNPRQTECQGRPCYEALHLLPEVPDLIGVAVAARRVPDVLRDAADLGVASAVVISAGFAEAGPEGVRLQEEVAGIAAERDILICGPNSVGIVHTPGDLPLTFTEALTRGELASGNVAMVSQSGAFGTVLYAKARERGVGISTYISSGNEASVTLGDYVEALVEEPEVGVVAAYVEGLRDVDSFRRASARARELGKPIVALKVGRTERSGKAAASHTGSLVGNDHAYRAALRRLGVVAVDDEDELLDSLSVLQTVGHKAPRKRRVAIISTSGGAGVLLTDLMEENGLSLASVSDELERRLREHLPEFASFGNPIDVTGRYVTDPTGLEEVIRLVASDPEVDLVVAFIGLAWSNPDKWEAAFAGLDEIAAPVIVSAPLLDAELSAAFRKRGVPVCSTLRQTAVACSALTRWGSWSAYDGAALPLLEPDTAGALPSGVLDEDSAKSLLTSVGVPVPRGRVAVSPEDAAALAAEMTGPAVLKVAADDITHKTDLGGVLLDVAPGDVADAYQRLLKTVGESCPDSAVDGVRVEEMVDGVEVVIGAVRAEPFGVLMAVGAGGTEVELKRDLAYGIAPVGEKEARAMIESLDMYPLLCGHRGREVADVDALVSVLVRVSRLAADLEGRLVEMDLNPVVVRSGGQGAVVLDALAVLD